MNKWIPSVVRCIIYLLGLYFLGLILSLFTSNVPYGALGQLAFLLSAIDLFITFKSKNGKLVLWGKKKEIKEDKIVYVDEIRKGDNKKK